MKRSSILANLAELDTTSICDAYSGARVVTEISPLTEGTRLFGRVRTVVSEADLMPVLEALRHAEEGDVLVIDSGGADKALFGELIVSEALRKGVAGIITDGPCRDLRGVRAVGLPVFARGTTPLVVSKEKVGALDVRIRFCDVHVEPEDYVVADDDGIVFLNAGELERLLATALQIQRNEAWAMDAMLQGNSLYSCYNIEEHYENLRTHQPTVLRFLR